MISVKPLKDGYVEIHITGEKPVHDIVKPGTKTLAKLALKAGVPADDIFAAVEEAKREKEAAVTIRVRWRDEPESEAELFDSFQDALDAVREAREDGTALEMRWGDTRQIAALDIDGVFPMTALTELAKATPTPAWVWRSHGGGLRGIYTASNGLSAAEAASLAALYLSQKSWARNARFELLAHTSHPRVMRKGQSAGDVQRCSGSWDGSHLWAASTHGDADEADIQDWLDRRGMELGGRYAHTLCPFEPHATDGQPPVMVSSDGVTCFKCRNTGHRSGGFASWGALLGKRGLTLIHEAAKRFVIWEHAQYLLDDIGWTIPTNIKRHAYVALVKALSRGDDPRMGLITPKRADRYVRGAGNLWLDSRTLLPVGVRSATFLNDYPSVMLVNAEGEMKMDATLRAKHFDTNVLLEGYAPILPLRGARLWGGDHHDGLVRVSIPSATRPSEISASYITKASRVPAKQIEQSLRAWFPGINIAYLRLLIGGRIFAESGVGALPMVAVEGVSGSGKSNTVRIAAVACGDDLAAIDLTDRGRIDESIGYAASQGSILLGDEFNKCSGKEKKARADAMLHLQRQHSYRRLYHGPVAVPLHALIVVTDTSFDDPTFRYSVQVGRRFYYVHLRTRTPNWQETCPDRDISALRQSRERAHLLDSFISNIADECAASNWRFFAEGSCLFHTVEQEFRADDADINDLRVQLRELWEYVKRNLASKAPDDFRGPGWLALPLDDHDSPVMRLWRTMFGPDPAEMHNVEKTSEFDLAELLGLDRPAILQAAKQRGRHLAFRFVDRRHNPTWVNGKLFQDSD